MTSMFVGGYYGDTEAMLRFINEHNIASVISLIDADVAPSGKRWDCRPETILMFTTKTRSLVWR